MARLSILIMREPSAYKVGRAYRILICFLTISLVILPTIHSEPPASAYWPMTSANTRRLGTGKEARVKALFLYRMARWTIWPESNLPKSSKTILIGIVGKDRFGKELDLVAKLKPVNGRKIKIKRFQTVAAIEKTQILIMSDSLSAADRAIVIKKCRRDSVLLASEISKFIDQGGMLDLLIKKKKLAFEVNALELKKAKLRISSRVLRMASRVIQKEIKK